METYLISYKSVLSLTRSWLVRYRISTNFRLLAGQALIEAGDTYRHLAEIKYNLEDNVKQNFLEPLTQLQTKDIKEVNVSSWFKYCRTQVGKGGGGGGVGTGGNFVQNVFLLHQ